MGSRRDLLGGFRGIATIGATEAAASVKYSRIQVEQA